MSATFPVFNFWTTLLLLAAGQGVFLSILIFSNRRKRKPHSYWLGGITAVFTLTLLDYLGYFTAAHRLFPHLASSYLWLTFLIGPLFYGYFRSFSGKAISGHAVLLHFVPALVVLSLQLPFFLSPTDVKVEVITGQMAYPNLLALKASTWNSALIILPLSHLLLYAGLSFRHLKRERTRRHDKVNRLVKTSFLLFSGYVSAYLLYVVMVFTPYYELVLDYSICLAMAFSIYAIAYAAYHRPQDQQVHKEKKNEAADKYRKSALTSQASQSLWQQVERFMKSETPFYDSDLRLQKLATALDVHPHHLSQAINEQFKQSFTHYINSYRIEKAKELLQTSDLRISEIAYQVGFNNKTTFYNAFKKETDASPSQYRKSLAEIDNKAQ